MEHSYPEVPVSVTETLHELVARAQQMVAGERATNVDLAEQELVALLAGVGRAVMAECLARLDPDGSDVLVGEQRWWEAVRAPQQYMTAFGRVSVERGVYRTVRNGPTLCPLELRAGIVEGFWTPRAAKLAALSVSDMTSYRSEQFFQELGMMRPSRSSLDRLPKTLNARWEAEREGYEARLRAEEQVPHDAVTVAVSLDGVMVPMREAGKALKKAEMRRQGRPDKGPSGYQEVACGTLSFYDSTGQRLLTRRMARMPEPNKATLKQQLDAELAHVLEQRPDLVVVAVADGAVNNWSYLETLPHHYEVVDFYHAVEHLKRALDVAMGATTTKTQRKFEQLRTILRDDASGVDTVIRSLVQLRPKRRGDPRDWRTGVNYFKRHRHRMKYAELQQQSLPIGSGVIEGTCKSLVSDRLKRAGMRWQKHGGQAVLNLRAWTQSGRFDNAWNILSDNYTAQVTELAQAA